MTETTDTTVDYGTLPRIKLAEGGLYGVRSIAAATPDRRCATIANAKLLASALNGEIKARYDDPTLVVYEVCQFVDGNWVDATEAS